MRPLSLLTIVLITVSMANADYSIPWYSIDGGGGTSLNGPYKIVGIIGQPDADYLAGGNYELLSGFLVGGPLCIVNLEHFASFAVHWLDGPCNEGNDWCHGADLNQLNDVTLDDLTILTGYWLEVCPFGWPLK
jgi:hypothetical protein